MKLNNIRMVNGVLNTSTAELLKDGVKAESWVKRDVSAVRLE